MTRAVAITGVGAISAAGPDAAHLLTALRDGWSGIRPAPELGELVAGRAPDPSRTADTRRLDRSAALFCAAAEEAWRSAGLDRIVPPERCAVVDGSSLGPMGELLAVHRARLANGVVPAPRPSDLVRFMPGAGGVAFAQRRGIRGPVTHLSAGSVSSAFAILQAIREIRSGTVEIAVAGGGEAPLQEDLIASFGVAGILARAPKGDPACRPFDRLRCGTVLGEGAGALVLETVEHARSRGAPPLAIVAGAGTAGEAYSLVRPRCEGNGVREASATALGGIDFGELGWIKAHGTGTTDGDAAECRGLAALFGRRLPEIPMTSLKPTLGHCLGASGAVEAVAAVLALQEGFVPATLGTTEPDPSLPPFTLATKRTDSVGPAALLLSEGFGGRSAALVVRRA
jgi:3-oxoacyl-(acyl-carrier-protein) synthase